MGGTTLAAMYYHLVSTGTEGFPLSTMAEKVPVFHNYAFEGPFMYVAIFLFFAPWGPASSPSPPPSAGTRTRASSASSSSRRAPAVVAVRPIIFFFREKIFFEKKKKKKKKKKS